MTANNQQGKDQNQVRANPSNTNSNDQRNLSGMSDQHKRDASLKGSDASKASPSQSADPNLSRNASGRNEDDSSKR